jgi:hypothetical protein
MSKPLTDEELEILLRMLKGNTQALKLCLDTIWVGQLWDQLIDKDEGEPREADIHSAFIKAFRNIPNNPWFISLPDRLRWQLEGLLISAAMQYKDSTHLEMGNDDDRFTAYIIRNAILSLVHYCIYLVGGDAWIDEQSAEFWQTFGNLREDYFEFVAEGHNEARL